jgi:protein-tyrosine-phosphatase
MATLPEVDGSLLTLHRSHRLGAVDVAWADAILTAEADHVRHLRRAFPDAAPTTVSVGQLIAEAPEGEPLSAQVALVAAREPDDRHDVTDPAGGDQSVYDDTAAQLWVIARQLAFGARD